jgi:hypothetical protein
MRLSLRTRCPATSCTIVMRLCFAAVETVAGITLTVTACGRSCFQGRKVNLSHAFAGQNVGVTQVEDRFWLVSVMQCDLG